MLSSQLSPFFITKKLEEFDLSVYFVLDKKISAFKYQCRSREEKRYKDATECLLV